MTARIHTWPHSAEGAHALDLELRALQDRELSKSVLSGGDALSDSPTAGTTRLV
jgi:hypothetical protein